MTNNLWFEKLEESTLDKNTQEDKFHKTTKEMTQTRINATVFDLDVQTVDSRQNVVSPTLALLVVLSGDIGLTICVPVLPPDAGRSTRTICRASPDPRPQSLYNI